MTQEEYQKLYLNKYRILVNSGNTIFVKVKIIDVLTDVSGSYGSKNNTGLKAISDDGGEYYNQYHQHDDLSMNPNANWFGPEGLLWDITLLVLGNEDVLKYKDTLLMTYANVLDYCDIHEFLYYKEYGICGRCQFEKVTNCGSYLRKDGPKVKFK